MFSLLYARLLRAVIKNNQSINQSITLSAFFPGAVAYSLIIAPQSMSAPVIETATQRKRVTVSCSGNVKEVRTADILEAVPVLNHISPASPSFQRD